MNLTFRLNRLILGESMLVPREIVRRTERLEVVRPRIVEIPERKEGRTHSVRTSRNIVDAGPNAPQLKRLIQAPYTQELSRPKAGAPWRLPLEPPLTFDPFGSTVRLAFADSQRPRWPKATRSTAGLPARPRPTVQAFLDSGAADE
ncbi:MAG: hypothetical protein VX944_12915 [Myxococcota bacterium]|nr:hypothetical protein [Myxococcota bacterium]